MDYAQARAILDKYGEDKCIQIIFDNGRVWLTSKPKMLPNGYPDKDASGKIIFIKCSELIELDEATDSIRYREKQHAVDLRTRERIQWDIVNPIECIQGFNFIPQDASAEQEYEIRSQWDHYIV